MIYIGVDPGKSGAWARIRTYPNGQVDVMVFPWDDAAFVDFMRDEPVEMENIVAAVEKVGAMPHQGVASTFNFGTSYGYIQGVLSACGIGYQLVPPAVWKREFSLIGKDKRASVDACKRLFPGVNLFPTEKCRKESDGMSDALLICLYAKRHFGENGAGGRCDGHSQGMGYAK